MQLTTLKKSLSDLDRYQKALPELQHTFGQVRRKSKHAISMLRRDSVDEAKKSLREAEKTVRYGMQHARGSVDVTTQGVYREAIEEYVEAKIYFSFVMGEKLVFPLYLELSFWDMLGGWSDFTGELVRRAISIAHEGDNREIEKLKSVAESVVELFSQVSFSGKLRNKYDATERNLKRLEEILYELKLREK